MSTTGFAPFGKYGYPLIHVAGHRQANAPQLPPDADSLRLSLPVIVALVLMCVLEHADFTLSSALLSGCLALIATGSCSHWLPTCTARALAVWAYRLTAAVSRPLDAARWLRNLMRMVASSSVFAGSLRCQSVTLGAGARWETAQGLRWGLMRSANRFGLA